ncbi:hypothetical protein HYW19_02165, partial [Candidatus Woesearchaeota archaeon]|nr:hypothetical protein [Candidatus Woesearchaeota archaeon]
MEKKGVDGFLDSKEAKVTTLLLFSILIVFVLTLSMSSVFVSALNISIYSPRNYSINANVSRNINITFNSTWQLGGAPADESPTNENVSNCTLYINSTDLKIAWDSVLNISGDSNATGGSNLTGYSGIHSNISNSSISYMNFTFPEDGNYTIGVACLNATNSTAVAGYTFSGNFSFFLDVSAPTFNFTYPLNTSFNTSSSTITSGINFTVNDTGIGLNWTNSTSMNITIHLGGSKIKNFVYNGSDGQSNLTCSPNSGVTRATSTCNATYAFNSNGTYTINATATDALGTFGFSLITFTVDQIPPRLRNFTITNGSTGAAIEFNMSDLQLGNRSGNASLNGVGTATQGRNITAFGNFSDNLTRPLMAILQFLNESKSSDNWQTLNTTNTNGVLSNSSDLIMSDRTVSPTTNFGIVNLTFLIPVGRNEFEGKNVTFRMLANDTFGNINNSGTASSVNLTILINDTFGPTIGINGGTAEANGTNTTDTTPTIVWNISESNRMTSINISVDFATGTGGIGVDSVCNKFAFYDKSSLSASANAERNRNGTFTITDDPACTLGNGTHNISIVAIDSWGNREVFHHVFSLQSGGTPGLNFNLTNEQGVGGWNKSATNNSNITSKVGISLFGVSSVGSSIDKISYFSSCDSTVRVENNGTIVYPFNASSCSSLSANRTLRVTINDTAGNSNTTVLGFLVDNVAPSLTVNHPTDGETFTNIEAIFNLTALDNDQAIG